MTKQTKLIFAGAALVGLLGVSAVGLLANLAISFSVGQADAARGQANMMQGRYEACIADYTRALQRSLGTTARTYALGNRGVCKARSEKPRADEAVDDLTAALRLNDQLAYVYLERGALRVRQNNDTAASEDFSRAIALDPNSSAALFYRGMVSARQKRWEAAIADFSEALRARPNTSEIYVQRALAHEQMNDSARARTNFDAAIQSSPKYIAAYLERGKFFARSREFTKAIADFSGALAIAPDDLAGRRVRAHAYAAAEQWKEAMADWTEVLRIEPRDETALEMRGRAYSWLRETEQALADLSELVRITQSGHAYEMRGRAFVRAGRYDEAVSDYGFASRHGGKSGIPVKGLAWLRATCPEASVRRGSEAVKQAVEACVRNDWQDWNSVDTLAAAYAEVGDFEHAVKYQEQALAAKNLTAEQRSELEERLTLYRAGTPYRDLPKP